MARLAHHERNFPFNRVVEPILSAVREPHGPEEDRRAVEGFKSLVPIKIGEGDTSPCSLCEDEPIWPM